MIGSDSARVWGIGVGPGDPELLTLKALRLIRAAEVIAFPAPEQGESFARSIVAPHLPGGQREIAIRMALGDGSFPKADIYDSAAEEILKEVAAGRRVAVLCEGDPFFYGSFIYLYERLAGRCPVAIVPGVSSLMACAGAAETPLALRNQSLTVTSRPLAGGGAAPAPRPMRGRGDHQGGPASRQDPRRAGGAGADRPRPLCRARKPRYPAGAAAAGSSRGRGAVFLHDPGTGEGMRPAVIILGPSALATGERAARAIDGELHGFAPRVPGCAVSFTEVGPHLRQLFAEGRPIIGLCAAGVLIRSLAPLLADKTREPPVLALAEDGSAAVPLLGGHHGANELARRLAEALGGQAAVTTAGDLRHGVALDTPPPGWRLGNPEAAKAIMAALLAGEAVALENETSVPSDWLSSLSLVEQGSSADHRDGAPSRRRPTACCFIRRRSFWASAARGWRRPRS